MHPLRTAIIGYGLSGKHFQLPLLHHHPEFQVTHIFTRNPRSIDEIHAIDASIQIPSTVDEIFANDAIDIVIIATPNEYHIPYTKRALLAHKHVVVEKPFTATADEADELIALAKRQQRLLYVFHNLRYYSDFLTVKQLLSTNRLGQIVSYESRFDRSRLELTGNWRETFGVNAGVFQDLAPHLVDQVLQLFGTPLGVYADIRIDRPNAVVDDHFELNLYYPHHVARVGGQMLARYAHPKFEIIGTQATYVKMGFEYNPPRDNRLPIDSPATAYDGEHMPSHGVIIRDIDERHLVDEVPQLPASVKSLYDDVAKLIRANDYSMKQAFEAREVVRVLQAAEESQKSRQYISLDGFPNHD